MWQYHKYRSLYVRLEVRCNEHGSSCRHATGRWHRSTGCTSAAADPPPTLQLPPPSPRKPSFALCPCVASSRCSLSFLSRTHDQLEVFIAVLRSPHFTSARAVYRAERVNANVAGSVRHRWKRDIGVWWEVSREFSRTARRRKQRGRTWKSFTRSKKNFRRLYSFSRTSFILIKAVNVLSRDPRREVVEARRYESR